MGKASKGSTAWCEPFQNGNEVKLFVAKLSEVGGGLVVNACP